MPILDRIFTAKEGVPIVETALPDIVRKAMPLIRDRLRETYAILVALVIEDEHWVMWVDSPKSDVSITIAVDQEDDMGDVVERLTYALEGKVVSPRAWYIFKHRDWRIFKMTTNLIIERQFRGKGLSENMFQIANVNEGVYNRKRDNAKHRVHIIAPNQAVQIAKQMAKVSEAEEKLRVLKNDLHLLEMEAFKSGRPVTNKELYQMLLDEEGKANDSEA